MFNLQGSEIIFILLLALVVLGPEKLPGAIKRATRTYAELRKLGTGFQSEFRSAIDEPMREMRETADLIKDQADPKRIAEEAEKAAETTAAVERADTELANAVEEDAGPGLDDGPLATDDDPPEFSRGDARTDPMFRRRTDQPSPEADPFADPVDEDGGDEPAGDDPYEESA